MPEPKRPRCRAKTNSGNPCRNPAKPGEQRCGTHLTKRTPKKRRNWQPAFLDGLRDLGTVTAACEAAGISRNTAYEHRTLDEQFAALWAQVEDEVTDHLEQVARERAVEQSDTLLIFLLKARRPDMYREKTRHEITGADGGPLTFADLARAAENEKV